MILTRYWSGATTKQCYFTGQGLQNFAHALKTCKLVRFQSAYGALCCICVRFQSAYGALPCKFSRLRREKSSVFFTPGKNTPPLVSKCCETRGGVFAISQMTSKIGQNFKAKIKVCRAFLAKKNRACGAKKMCFTFSDMISRYSKSHKYIPICVACR